MWPGVGGDVNTWLMRERPPMPGGGDSGGEPNPLPVKRPEAENRDIALKTKKYQTEGGRCLAGTIRSGLFDFLIWIPAFICHDGTVEDL